MTFESGWTGPRTPRPDVDGLPDGHAIALRAFVAGATPPERKTVSQWAGEKREVSAEGGSPQPGKWDNDLAPYLVEIMDCLSLTDRCRSVVFKKSAQVAGTEAGLNLFGYVVDQHQAPMMIVLPSLDEAKKYVKVKLQPAIDATPALFTRVREQKSRDEDGSTTSLKKFRGGYCQITGANSSKGLQMLSARVVIYEEVSEWPFDVDGRGDPVDLAHARTTAWTRNRKEFFCSTPGLKGSCRISAIYAASDQRRYYVPCPHCGAYQVLKWENLKWDQERAPYGAHFLCAAKGCRIDPHHKRVMVATGRWVKTFADDDGVIPPDVIAPDDLDAWRSRSSVGKEPGFAIWQAYSPFVPWDDTAKEYFDSRGDQAKEKVFVQQRLGEDYEEKGDSPDDEILMLRRQPYPMGRLPPGALVLTGMADVQGNRIEWSVYGWGIDLQGWLVDRGIIEGDPEEDAVWTQLGAVTERQYEDWQGRLWPIEAFGVDSGFLSHRVYLFCRGRPRVFALDGRPGHLLPMIGTPVRKDINWRGKVVKGGVMLWPTGTFALKSWVYGGLRKTIAGPDESGQFQPGTLHFPAEVDREFFQQITAEHLAEVEQRQGYVIREWRKKKNRPNEELDKIVGARAMAAHLGLDRMSPAGRAKLIADCGQPPDAPQPDLAALWAPKPGETPKPAPQAQPSPPPTTGGGRRLGGTGRSVN
ncbi:MAG: phage terminase large subunit family protein [Inquilinus sp.]|uniref:phage terminase large subunit family protein n=1 Tax=Inquilinus sp. TaxID=1932117 RepID=UPI003F412571